MGMGIVQRGGASSSVGEHRPAPEGLNRTRRQGKEECALWISWAIYLLLSSDVDTLSSRDFSFITQISFLCPVLSVRDTEMVLATVLYYLNVMDKETGSESLINLPKAPIRRVRILNLALYRSKVHVSSSMEVSHCT